MFMHNIQDPTRNTSLMYGPGVSIELEIRNRGFLDLLNLKYFCWGVTSRYTRSSYQLASSKQNTSFFIINWSSYVILNFSDTICFSTFTFMQDVCQNNYHSTDMSNHINNTGCSYHPVKVGQVKLYVYLLLYVLKSCSF